MTSGDKFFNSVRLDTNLCKGCINCIKRCPTQAIRVRNGKAVITREFCIDCGECIKICPHHAKLATYDPLSIIDDFEYTVALPAPSLYGQFNNLDDVNIVLNGLLKMGFDEIAEVSAAAELVSGLTRKYIAENQHILPIISTACPSVVRLIRVRFPNLIEHLLPINAPFEIAAAHAREEAIKKTGLPSEKIGIIFISPCPAKVTAVKSPLALKKSGIDGVLAIKEVYPKLLAMMNNLDTDNLEDVCSSGKIGVCWGGSGGEASGLLTDNYLAADGIENVIHVLEDLEDQKFSNLAFIELNACSGGCVGGVLTVENPYLARVKIKKLGRYKPVACNHIGDELPPKMYWENSLEYEPVFKLGENIAESVSMLAKIEDLCKRLPGLDCGSCGAPTCKALAEDVARGVAYETDCIHLFRQQIRMLSDQFNMLDKH